MKDLDRYLDRATRGLPKVERLRVREELRGSVLERAAEHHLAGLSEGDALRLALREFGDPVPLASGMRRIHLWPRLALLGGLSSAALALGLVAVLPSLEEPALVTTQGLVARCVGNRPPPWTRSCSHNQTFWVNLTGLQQQLTAQGATLETRTRTFPNLELTAQPPPAGEPPTLTETFLRVTWPDAEGVTSQVEIPITDERFDAFIRGVRRGGAPATLTRDSEQVFQRRGTTFIDGQTLLYALRETANRPVTIERPLDGPVVRVGRLTLKLGEPGQGIAAGEVVQQEVNRLLVKGYGATTFLGGGLLPRPGTRDPANAGFAQEVAVKGRPGDLYVVVRPMTQPGKDTRGLGFDGVTVARDGHISFRTAQPRVRFTSDLRALAQSGSGKAAVALLHLGSGLRWEQGGQLRHRVEVP